MPSLNLVLDHPTNLKLNEIVAAIKIADPSRSTNRSDAARKAIVELHSRMCKCGEPRDVISDLEESFHS